MVGGGVISSGGTEIVVGVDLIVVEVECHRNWVWTSRMLAITGPPRIRLLGKYHWFLVLVVAELLLF